MIEMKHYIIALTPEEYARKRIEDFRMKHIGTATVDGLPPHVTLKSRFTLREGFTEDDLIERFSAINIEGVRIIFDAAETLGDALVLRGKNEYLEQKHIEIKRHLEDISIDLRPEFEGENYKMHMNLLRGKEVVIGEYLGEMRFDKVCLYEIDVTSNRAYAHEIACKTLE